MTSRSRGRTAPGRLRALDALLLRNEGTLLSRPGVLRALDVGLGDEPHTTLEWSDALATARPDVEVLGVDHDPQRVGTAERFARPGVRFVEGSFASLAALGPARLVRAMNVLRGAREQEVSSAHAGLAAALEDGGLALEGSSAPDGELLTALWLRKRGDALAREALVFHTDFSRGFAPWMFRDWLPRELRRQVKPGSRMHAFLSAWDAAFRKVRARSTPAELFRLTSEAFAATAGPELDPDPWLAANGYLLWRPGAGVPDAGSP